VKMPQIQVEGTGLMKEPSQINEIRPSQIKVNFYLYWALKNWLGKMRI